MNTNFKIINFEKNGNQVKFYIGTEDCKDYYGDDWDDAPYEHNAGSVYDRFVAGWFVKTFDFDDIVMEPCEGSDNSRFCKDDMKAGRVPCICVLPKEFKDDNTWYYDFEDISNDVNVLKFYFNDIVDVEKEDVHFVRKYNDTDLYVSFEFDSLSEDEKRVVFMATKLMSDTIKYTACDYYLEEIAEDGFEKVEKLIKKSTNIYEKYLKMASDVLNVKMDKKPVSRLLDAYHLNNAHYLNQFICYKSDNCFKIGKISTKFNYSERKES